MRKKFMLSLVFCFWIATAGLALAQFSASDVEFTDPAALNPSQEFDFSFLVTNAATSGDASAEWIMQVELSMPSDGYVVNSSALTAPAPLHPTEISEWEVNFLSSTNTITWSTVAMGTTATGDIREQESLAFDFTATTDAEATDGFDWELTGDGGTIVSGTAYIGDEPGDDDDDDDDDDTFNDDDDDTDSFGGDDDDDDDSGCGC